MLNPKVDIPRGPQGHPQVDLRHLWIPWLAPRSSFYCDDQLERNDKREVVEDLWAFVGLSFLLRFERPLDR